MKRSILDIDSLSSLLMPIDKPSIRVFFDDESLRLKFKQLAVVAKISMTKRVIQFIEKDVAFWEQTGEILDLDILDEGVKADSQLSNQENGQSNGHHFQQQAKVTKPPKHHKTYKGQAGEDGDLDIWYEDIKADSQLSNQGNSQTNSYDFPQVKVTNPQRNHKRYKNKVGDLVSELDSARVKVSFDGDIETFHSDEIEIVG